MKRRQLLQSTLAFGTLSSVALSAPAVVADKQKADMSTDVVIVGGGFAGLAAAVTASALGRLSQPLVPEPKSWFWKSAAIAAATACYRPASSRRPIRKSIRRRASKGKRILTRIGN